MITGAPAIMKPDEFITSDTHFGHENVIKYSKRPFKNADEMDTELIKRWNAKVPKQAIIYHLGDFSFHKPGITHGILNRLNGRICLIKGNHDKLIKGDLKTRFEWIKDYYETSTLDNKKVVMMHYALLTWNGFHRGSWMLHGHSHGSLKVDMGVKRVDIGVDTQGNYEPYSFQEIEALMNKRKITQVDHHKVRE